jgi:hypothetical protein
VTEIFGHGGEEAEHIKYANWLSMVHAGVKGLEMFSPASMEWKQAHSQARSVGSSVADPDPGSGAFLPPGSGIRDGAMVGSGF